MAGKSADTSSEKGGAGGAGNPAGSNRSGTLSFEAQLERLEQLVGELEAGARPLDESLKLYEDGVAALRACHSILDQAEKRIRVLVESRSGELSLKDVRVPGKAPAPAPDDEDEDDDEDDEDGEPAEESSENSSSQPIDSPPTKRENLTPNPGKRPRSPGAPLPKAGGGSLFGRPE